MWACRVKILLLVCVHVFGISDDEDPILYYYGLEESERSLPECVPRQACSTFLQRYWRAPALVRLCRCARRRRCDTIAPQHSHVELNNHAHLQFCEPLTEWPECTATDTHLVVETEDNQMNPDTLEDLHHKNIELAPPKIILNCKCQNPFYWRLKFTEEMKNLSIYQCGPLALCKTGEFCGNVNYDLNALYQSCLCPKKHICVHNGGIKVIQISELLYHGSGWPAYCQNLNEDYSYEDY